MKILCVEDGSVDLDALEEELSKDVKILVYRNGATLPFILELNDTDAKLEELKERKAFAIRELRNVQSQIMNDRLQLSNYLVNRIKELGGEENE